MDIERDIKHWVELADYDLRTAEAMLNSKRYLYVLFCCQQALEKKLKGLVVKVTKSFPPRTHDLLRLAALANVPSDEEKENILRKITNYYIGTRYPEEVRELYKTVDKRLAKNYFDLTEEILEWLDSLLKQKT